PPEAHLALIERVRQEPVEQHIVGLRRAGEEAVHWLSLSFAPVLGEDKTSVGCVVVFRDITAQREAEMAQTNALEAARQALRVAEEERGTLRERVRYYIGLLHATLEASADGVLVRDLQGRPVLYNRRFVEMFGRRPMALSPEDLKNPGHPFFAIYADPHEAAEQMRYMFETPSITRRDILRLKDGRLIERTVRPQRLRGEVIGQVATYRDITEQRRLEAALRERTAYLYGVIDASPMCIFVKDREGRYQLANRALANLFGLDVREFAGHTDAEIGARIGLDPANVA
ncbi:MAG: PAS domain-containing protein, partial [Chloroflexi bacterium]|nr:PAS domain-containing protein [Chloroflexota bacterium]